MKQNYLKEQIKLQFQEQKNNLQMFNYDFIIENINNSNDETNIIQCNISDIVKGGFYFMFYDLNGKSSNMEKYNPVFIIDQIDNYIYAVSINFIPLNIRILLFNEIVNSSLQQMKNNIDTQIIKQLPIQGINFSNIYKLLFSIGFEWSIRKFDYSKINKIYKINTNIISNFITMSTEKLTQVNDSKLVQIQNKKITEQQQRHQDLMDNILSNYDNIQKTLNEKINVLQDKEENLQKTINTINKLFNTQNGNRL